MSRCGLLLVAVEEHLEEVAAGALVSFGGVVPLGCTTSLTADSASIQAAGQTPSVPRRRLYQLANEAEAGG
jgi:hypothetical protein